MKQIGTFYTLYGALKSRILVLSVPNDGTKLPDDLLVLNEDDKSSADAVFEAIADLTIGRGEHADKFYAENQMTRGMVGLSMVVRYTTKLKEDGLSMASFAGGVANRLAFKLDNSEPFVTCELDNWLVEAAVKADEQIGELLVKYKDEGYTHIKAEVIFTSGEPRTEGTAKVIPYFPEEGEHINSIDEFTDFITVNLKRSLFYQLSR